jgi:hypothetical protein
LGSWNLKNKEISVFFLESVSNSKNILKTKDQLAIYLRYDENYEENKEFCEELFG